MAIWIKIKRPAKPKCQTTGCFNTKRSELPPDLKDEVAAGSLIF